MVHRLDYHIHTKLCRHAIGEIEDYAISAIAKNLTEIGFADHLPMIYLPSSIPQQDYCMDVEQLPLYEQMVIGIQEKYPDMIIKMGIEADYYQGQEETIKQLLSRLQFDYIYGSVHVVDDWVIDDDRNRKRYEEYLIFDLYEKYFTILAKAVQSGLYDIVAHLDLPKKYGDRPMQSIEPLVDRVIDALVQKKKCIEVNTSGFRKPVKEQYPSNEILHRCYENDIQVTLGSDSHRPEEVGWEIERAISILQDIGYTQIVGFKKRKKIFYDI